jgi:single-stranded-DNA-specific exonuclease
MNQNNDDRKDEQALCEYLAMEQAQEQLKQNRFIIICHVPEASHGVVGLAAGRIAAATGRPAIVFADSHTGQLTGSARSIPGYDIRYLIERTHMQTERISKYGGHAAAAGLTIENTDDLMLLKTVMNDLVMLDFNHDSPTANLLHDGECPIEILTTQGLQLLTTAGPFGQGFASPTFCLTSTIISIQSMGKNGQHARLKINNHGQPIDAVWFNIPKPLMTGERYQFAMSINENHFRGNVSIQANILAAEKQPD